MLRGSTARGFQLASRRFFSPWNRPQSTRIRVSPCVTRWREPVTVPAPPRKVSEVIAPGRRRSLAGGHAVPAAAPGSLPGGVPAGGLRVVAIDQHRLYFLDVAGLHREELAHQAVEGGDRRGVHRTIELAETQDGQHDAALLVDHRMAPVPEIAADEAAALETLGGRHIGTVTIVGGELRTVLEA